jgi:hypothetical protein
VFFGVLLFRIIFRKASLTLPINNQEKVNHFLVQEFYKEYEKLILFIFTQEKHEHGHVTIQEFVRFSRIVCFLDSQKDVHIFLLFIRTSLIRIKDLFSTDLSRL